jgi:uncharacterized protein (TIGR02598 family)
LKTVEPSSAFSLTEVVVALGLFAFSVLAVVALMPVGMNSARSVAEESSAVNLSEAFFGAWLVAPTNATVFPIPGMFTNPPVPIQVPDSDTMFFRGDGEQVASAAGASMQMFYNVTSNASSRSVTIDLTFQWPITTATNVVQTRRFTQVIPR